MNSSFNLDPNIEPPIPSHIEASDDNSSVSNLSLPTQLPIRTPNKVDELKKKSGSNQPNKMANLYHLLNKIYRSRTPTTKPSKIKTLKL